MGKRSTSSSKLSTSPCSTPTNTKMVLRLRTSKKLTREDMDDDYCEKEDRPTSSKRSKTQSLNKKLKKNVDANKPKKPPTAFFFFLEDFRKIYQEENPQVKAMRDVGKACGEKWRTMTYEEKVKYYDIATEKRAEFDRAIAEYTRRKESGEDVNLNCQSQSLLMSRSQKDRMGDRLF